MSMQTTQIKRISVIAASLLVAGTLASLGCDRQAAATRSPREAASSAAPSEPAGGTARTSPGSSRKRVASAAAKESPRPKKEAVAEKQDALFAATGPSPNELLRVDLTAQATDEQRLPRPEIDVARAAVAGIRKISGKHLDLYTDLPPSDEVDQLPHVFDLAVPQWCEYFQIDAEAVESWKMIGHIIDRRERFAGTGLLPDDLPPFLNGYQRGWQFWVYEQPSAYYRRHLLLHEGTHAFMWWRLGGCGPPWYMEGMAELLATHRWHDGRLQLKYFPQNRAEVEQWGRIKIIQDDVKAGRGLTLQEITRYDARAHLRIEPYGWSWAASAFLDGHPDFRPAFRSLQSLMLDAAGFDRCLSELFQTQGRRLSEQWQLFARHLDYGFEIAREAIVYTAERPLPESGTSVHVAADRGWQSTGIRLEPAVPYLLESTGRFQIGTEPKTWWCEPGGVTIAYYRGRPLGMLLAAVSDPSQPLRGTSPLALPEPIGLGGSITAPEGGILFLRINDDPSQLADNAGELLVTIRRQ